ncbi:MAG TPA: DUF5777 family beta-barrel protein [Bacteroidales bacterium]|nr:DUF5777 family beta-barrel protein [Bacteroidales bacterium]HSA42598.1 DUF5777 family beta-barrel protein [Bacteroidales bacterium]
MKKAMCLIAGMLSILTLHTGAQDLLDLLDEGPAKPEVVTATFKTTRLVNGQSIENPANGVLVFIISHRFGRLNQGAYELFGLDQSTIRFGLEYGVNDRLALGLGRSSYQKTFDGFLKYRILRQSSGKGSMPVSLSLFSSMAINSLKWQVPERKNFQTSRYSYVHQLLLARKFSNRLSLQLTPSLIHKNLVPTEDDKNNLFAAGLGGRFKLTNRTTFNAEYWYLLPDQTTLDVKNCLALGLDVETGGHVFQLMVTNAQPQFERAFITETQGNFFKGDLYFGFNITRVFTLKKPKEFSE